MSSRVGTAIPATPSTARSSAAVGFTRSIQTALSGKAASSGEATFRSEDSDGMNTENMEDPTPDRVHAATQQDLARFWQAPDGLRINLGSTFVAARRQQDGADSAASQRLPQNR